MKTINVSVIIQLNIRGELADVEDGDGDVFSIELERLTLEN